MLGLRHLAIRARDLAATRRFYEEGLGLQYIDWRPSGTAVDLTDGSINLTVIPYEGPARTPAEEGAEFMHLGFMVEDVAATYRRLIELGAPVVRDDVKKRDPHDPTSVPVGSFKVLDPDGNVIDVSDRPDEWRTRAPAATIGQEGPR